MQAFNFEEFKNLDINPYQVYGLDIDYQQYYAIQNYLRDETDTIDKDQPLNILFFDIEVYTHNAGEFPKPEQAKFPINAITIYSTFEKVYRSYFLLQHLNIHKFPSKEEIPSLIKQFKEELVSGNYIKEGVEDIDINVFTNEIDLIKSCWNQIKLIDPAILSSWNGDRFDLPYIYFRLSELLNKNETEVCKILSQFGRVKIEKMGNELMVKIPEYPVLDLLYLYKPRDDGGLNMGKKQSSYALNYISEDELNLGKQEYKSEGMTIDQFYERDPVNFLLYNITDTALCVRLNERLKHIESYNLLRRLMKTPFTASLRGSSVLFDTYVNYKLNKEGKYTRFGILEETSIEISEDEVASLFIPKSMKRTIKVKDVSQQTFRAITGHFPGAYVKESTAQILTSKDGVLVDLDASSLYPSMITQLNISFDTFFGKIIDPLSYKFINTLNQPLSMKMPVPQNIYLSLYDMIVKYTNDKHKPQNKGEYIQYCYIIIAYLIQKLEKYKKSLNQLFNPVDINDYIVLKRYLLPLIELFEDIHPNSKEYNSFCHEYLINDGFPEDVDSLYIIEDILKPSIKVTKIPAREIADYLKTNNLIMALSGCLFTKHELKRGLFIDFLKNLKDMRNQYEKQRDQYKEHTYEYDFYDMRQKSIKVSMNTTYGLFGQATYRFSNKHLAKSITTQGRLSLKIAQIIAEMYLESLELNKQN